MIWSCGLPRCGGQTLQHALGILTGKNYWHSIQPARWDSSIKPSDGGAVELYAPLDWLARYPGGPHTFIHNIREIESWYKSCEKVRPEAQENHWNHPLWSYPLSQFKDYYHDWHKRMHLWEDWTGNNIHTIDIIHSPSWDRLCQILKLSIPDQPFPNVDMTRPAPTAPGNRRFEDFFGYTPENPFEF